MDMASARQAVPDLRVLKTIRTGAQEEETERFHSFHEMFYVAEGSCSVFIGQRVHRLKKGDFAVIPAGTVHRTDYLSAGQNTKIVLSFSKRTAREIDQFLGGKAAAGRHGRSQENPGSRPAAAGHPESHGLRDGGLLHPQRGGAGAGLRDLL